MGENEKFWFNSGVGTNFGLGGGGGGGLGPRWSNFSNNNNIIKQYNIIIIIIHQQSIIMVGSVNYAAACVYSGTACHSVKIKAAIMTLAICIR